MSANPTVDRDLADKAMDHIDHALGRPVWPLRESYRNYFATDAGGELAASFDASEHWHLNGVSGDMAYYAVTDAGRAALAAHMASLVRQHHAWSVTFEGHTTVVPAETAGKAKYCHWLRVSDCWADLTFAAFCRDARVRRAA